MKKLLLIAFAALAFAACSDDDKTPTPSHVETITFSDAELGADGYLWGKTLASDEDGSLEFEGVIYKEGKASFLSYFQISAAYGILGASLPYPAAMIR